MGRPVRSERRTMLYRSCRREDRKARKVPASPTARACWKHWKSAPRMPRMPPERGLLSATRWSWEEMRHCHSPAGAHSPPSPREQGTDPQPRGSRGGLGAVGPGGDPVCAPDTPPCERLGPAGLAALLRCAHCPLPGPDGPEGRGAGTTCVHCGNSPPAGSPGGCVQVRPWGGRAVGACRSRGEGLRGRAGGLAGMGGWPGCRQLARAALWSGPAPAGGAGCPHTAAPLGAVGRPPRCPVEGAAGEPMDIVAFRLSLLAPWSAWRTASRELHPLLGLG